MQTSVTDVANTLSYYKLYDSAEQQRWAMKDIEWAKIDKSAIDEGLIEAVRALVFGELTTYSATQAFMQLFADDIDFTQWLGVWLYEETKHPHVLVKWLSEIGETIDAPFIEKGREIIPMTSSRIEMLCFNIISETVAGTLYSRTSKYVPEKILVDILQKLGKDEMRHSVGFETYCRDYIQRAEDPDKERLVCLRAAWAFLENDQLIQHPVFLTIDKVLSHMDEDLGKQIRKQIRKQVSSRIGKLVGIDIPEPEDIYQAYNDFKGSYRKKRKALAQ